MKFNLTNLFVATVFVLFAVGCKFAKVPDVADAGPAASVSVVDAAPDAAPAVVDAAPDAASAAPVQDAQPDAR